MLSFALANWGPSSAWISHIGHIKKKTMIHHTLLRSLKSLGHFQCFEERQHKCSFEFPFVQERGVSAPSLKKNFLHVEIVT